MSICASCQYWHPNNGNRDTAYTGDCVLHHMRVEFNFCCKDHKAPIIKAGETLSPEKLNIGYHPSVRDFTAWYDQYLPDKD